MIMEWCVKPEWCQGLDMLLEYAEPGRGFVMALGDWVAMSGYPFILWRALEDRNARRYEVVAGWRVVHDYVNDWETQVR
ncbi:hypothetical protein SUGI_0269190 [Cryptomeria japonica]|nr:hypothetical protein SUGI_0269190 [Cryptomeria japonica]